MQLRGLAGNTWPPRSAVELLSLGGEKDLVWIFKPLPGKFFFLFFFFYDVRDKLWLKFCGH